MKLNVTILMLMILLISNSITAQTKEDYLLKSKHQKTAAWILLGGGIALGTTGSLIKLNDLLTREPNKKIKIGGGLMFLGFAATLGSLPFFIGASKNRNLAMNLSFTNQPLPGLVKNMVGNKYVPSMSLHIKL